MEIGSHWRMTISLPACLLLYPQDTLYVRNARNVLNGHSGAFCPVRGVTYDTDAMGPEPGKSLEGDKNSRYGRICTIWLFLAR